MNELRELSVTFSEKTYIRLYSLDEKPFLAIQIPDLALKGMVYDCLCLTRSGFYLPCSIKKYAHTLCWHQNIRECEIRIKMIGPREDMVIRNFIYEVPSRSEFNAAVAMEIEYCSQILKKPAKRVRKTWSSSFNLSRKDIFQKNINEIRRGLKIGGILILYDDEHFPKHLIDNINKYRSGQVVLLTDKYRNLRWQVPADVLRKADVFYLKGVNL